MDGHREGDRMERHPEPLKTHPYFAMSLLDNEKHASKCRDS